MIVLAGGDFSRPTYVYVTGGWGGGAENQLLIPADHRSKLRVTALSE